MKQQDTSSLRRSVTFSIVLTMFFLIVIIVTVTNLIQNYTHNQYEKEHTVQVYSSVERTIEHYVKEYRFIAKRIIKTTDLVELLKKKDRETIYKLFKHKWELMHEEEPLLRVMHFHLKDGSSFLRMHNPEVFGENLIEARPMLREIHHSHQITSGYETGKHGSLYRVITPVFDEKQTYIGALELGLDINFIVRELHEINNMHGLIFLKDDKSTLLKNLNTLTIDGYKLNSEPMEEFKVISKALTTLNFDKDDVVISAGEKQYNIHAFTLNDFQGQPKVKILIFHKTVKKISYEEFILALQSVLILLSLALLIWFVYRRINNYEKIVSNLYEEQIKQIEDSKNELKLSEAYLQGVLEVIPNIMIITDGKKISGANSAMLKFTGFNTFEEFKQKHECICDFFIEEANCLLPMVENLNWMEYIISKPNKIHEVSMIKDGEQYRFIVQAKQMGMNDIKRGGVVTFTDITEIEEIKMKLDNNNRILLENEEKFKAITNSALDAIIMLDNRGRLIFWNPKAKDMLGYEEDEIMGKDFHKIVAPKAFHEASKVAYEKFARTGEGAVLGQILELSAIKKGGHEFPISLVLSGVQIDGEWHGIGFMRDITERNKLQSEIKQKDEIMLAQSRQAAMGDMISMIAHQWRQPITAIGMGAQNLQLDIELDDIDPKRFDTKLSKIVELTTFLSKTIDDFRDFLKPNKKPDTSMLSKILNGALAIVGKSLENNNITLKYSLQSNVEITTYSNEVIQVLINIINNAKDIMKIKEIDDGIIKLNISHDEETAKFEICDNAGGIPEDILPRIFEPYFSTKEEKGGTGLGLYMSKMIVQKHLKGIISAHNSAEGACFSITIPLMHDEGDLDD